METYFRPNPVDMLKPSTLMEFEPDYYGPRFQAIADLRAQDDGTLHRGNEFRRVASLVNVPLALAARMTDPNFMRNKREFYAWLRANPEYRTYEKKGGSRPSVTFTNGEQTCG